MPHFIVVAINRAGRRSYFGTFTRLSQAIAYATGMYDPALLRSIWVETDGANESVVKFRIGEALP